MADVHEHFSDTAQEKSETNDVQVIASKKEKREKQEKKKCYVSFSSESLSTDIHSEPVDKIQYLQALKNLPALFALKFVPSPC